MATPRTTPLRERMREDLQLAGLSERTQEAYLRAVRQLAEHFERAPDQLTEPQVREYFLFLKNEKRFAAGSLRIAYYGIRFFFCHTVPREWPTLEQVRIPKQETLPDVLSIDEVRRLIDAVRVEEEVPTMFRTVPGGPRAGEMGGGVCGSSRCCRMATTTGGSVRKERILMCPPQAGQSSGNTS